jgi:hypothetical protein
MFGNFLLVLILFLKVILTEERKMKEVGSLDKLKMEEFERFDKNNDKMLDP